MIGIDAQLEALAERIAGLPKSVSAAPFFKQMEKIEALKAEETTKLRELEVQKGCQDEPASIEHYSAFLKGLRAMGNDPLAEEIRKKIMHKLVTRIEVLPDTFRVHFHVGGNYVEGELIHSEGSDPLNGGSSDRLKRRQHFFSQPGSNKLENGVPTGIRTLVTALKRQCPRPLDDGDVKGTLKKKYCLTGGRSQFKT